MIAHSRFLAWLAMGLFFVASSLAFALPPVGITQVRSVEDNKARIAVIEGTGYISASDGIHPINQDGVLPLVVPVEPTFGPLALTTRVIADASGEIFFGAIFGKRDIFFGPRAGRYSLDDPSAPAFTWPGTSSIIGFDSSLTGYNQISILLPDGSRISPIPISGSALDLIHDDEFLAGDVTPNGYILGDVGFTGTIGGGPALRRPNSIVEILGDSGSALSIRDRLDGNGVNIGFREDEFVKYGDENPTDIDGSLGSRTGSSTVIVSESDFTIVEGRDIGARPDGLRLFYPGVNPAGIDRSVALLDFFPELQSLDFDKVLDITSAGGQIHLLLSGDDGLWLFAAPDPSLIPEPGTITLSLVLLGCLSVRCRWRPGRPEQAF